MNTTCSWLGRLGEIFMRIESVTISGFRSFGAEPVTVALAGDVTAVIGPNASGKTAFLQAIAKLFGVTRAQRTIDRSDFHLPPDVDPSDLTPCELYIDVLIAFPELARGSATSETVAPTFRHSRIERLGASPSCRIRLEARWDDDGTAEGEVSQNLYWIDTFDATIKDEQRHTLSPSERGLIQLYYTPASRDAAAQIRATTGALAARLLRAIAWSEDTKVAIEAATKGLSGSFNAEAAIKAISRLSMSVGRPCMTRTPIPNQAWHLSAGVLKRWCATSMSCFSKGRQESNAASKH
jgi:putative ATP-dependent endonuclease of OLD family